MTDFLCTFVKNKEPNTAEYTLSGIVQGADTISVARYILLNVSAKEINHLILNIKLCGGEIGAALAFVAGIRHTTYIDDVVCPKNLRITTRCYGYVPMAGVIIAQLGSIGQRYMSENALAIIHDSRLDQKSAYNKEMDAVLEILTEDRGQHSESVFYKTEHRRERLLSIMAENNGNGKWLSPDEMTPKGLIDAIITPKIGKLFSGGLSRTIK